MPIPAAAEQELRDILQRFAAAHSGIVAPGGQGKALEAWVLMKLADAVHLRLPSWTVSLRRGDGTLVPVGAPFTLPDGQSAVRPAHPHAPGHVLLEHPRRRRLDLEIHGSLQWKGRSGATHECDVSVLPRSIGSALRASGGGHPRGLPIAAVECKDKGDSGKLDETRQTLGRMFDLALVTQPPYQSVGRIYEENTGMTWGRRRTRYISFFGSGTFSIVRAGTFQGGATTLASHYRIRHDPLIYAAHGAMDDLRAHFLTTIWRAGTL